MAGKVRKLKSIGSCGARFVACSWVVTFFFASISSLLGGVFMATSRVYSDTCIVLDDFPLKISELVADSGSGQGGPGSMSGTSSSSSGNTTDIVKGCWEDKSIFDILGLGKSLTFNKQSAVRSFFSQ